MLLSSALLTVASLTLNDHLVYEAAQSNTFVQKCCAQRENGEGESAIHGPEDDVHAAERQVRPERRRCQKASRTSAIDPDEVAMI